MAAPVTGPAQLLERDEQLAVLEDAFVRAQRGEGRLVLLRGEAGIGKTSLVNKFSGRARHTLVLSGSCDPLSTPSPLGPVVDILAQLDDPALDDISGLPRAELFRRILDGVTRPTGMTLVIVEDVHWADEVTLDLLRFLGRRIHAHRGMVVVTYRDDELHPDHPLRAVAGDLATAPATVILDLPSLSRDAIVELIERSGSGDVLDPDTVHRSTAGNPFFATEVLADPHGGLPANVRDAVLARASRLSQGAKSVLAAVAVVASRAETWLIEQLADADDADIDACVTAGMLRPDLHGTVAFRHELARQAILENTPPGRRARLHAAVAATLLSRHGADVDPARIAHHAEEAGDTSMAREHAVQAAERASRVGAHRDAVAQYERALVHADDLGAQPLADLLEGFAQEALRVDRTPEALEAATRAVALRRQGEDRRPLGSALILQSRCEFTAGDSQQSSASIHAAIRALEPFGPSPELAVAHATASSSAMLSRDHDEALSRGRKAIELAERVGAPEALARALNSVGSSRLVQGDTGGRDDLRRSIAIASELGDDASVALGWLNLGSALGEVRDYPSAQDALEEGITFARESDLDASLHYALAWLARIRFEQGDFAGAKRIVHSLPLHRSSVVTRIVGLTVLGRMMVRRGESDSTPVLEEAWSLAAGTEDLQRLWPIAATRAEAAWLGGDPAAAGTVTTQVLESARRHRHPWAIGELTLWERRCTDREFDFEMAPTADLEQSAAPFALHLGGHLREAAAAWQRLGCPYEAADALADSDDSGDLREALEILDRLGAGSRAAHVRRRLRALGERDVPRGPRRDTASHPAGLTARQAEVLELVGRGLTDREIAGRLHLSPKTVGHHVSAVLSKLGVASRGEATHAAHVQGLLTTSGGPRPDRG